MPMAPFYSKFPDLAINETRVIHLRGQDDLPDGEYGFIELYCDESGCDCRRVIINVLNPATGPRVWATINYGWESLEFYERWLTYKEDAAACQGPSLDPLNAQTIYAPALLRWFEFALTNEQYVERLKRHYELFKGTITARQRVSRRKPKRKGRK